MSMGEQKILSADLCQGKSVKFRETCKVELVGYASNCIFNCQLLLAYQCDLNLSLKPPNHRNMGIHCISLICWLHVIKLLTNTLYMKALQSDLKE